MNWVSGLLMTLGAVGLGLGFLLMLRFWYGRRQAARTERRVRPDRRRQIFGWRSAVFVGFALVFTTAGLSWYLSQRDAAPRSEPAAADAVPPGGMAAPTLGAFRGVAPLGSPGPAGVAIPGSPAAPSNAGGDLAPLVQRLKAKLDADPSPGDGWLLLARAYGQLQRYPEADAAYREAAKRLTPDADLLADWVDAHVMARQRQWDGEARNLLQRALASNDRHLKTLSLAGSEAYSRGDYVTAIKFWERLKAAAPAGSMELQLADANLAEARRQRSAQP
jgi:cytochrome c-type biogenesis protein CcmH